MFVAFHYRMRDGDGHELDATTRPLRTILGAHLVVPGLEQALLGRRAGDRFQVDLTAAEGFGERDAAAVRSMPRDAFPPESEVVVGAEFRARGDDGRELPFWVAECDGDAIVVDFNHPLAGLAMGFDVEVVEVRRPTLREVTELRQELSTDCV
jgi:FKBP-type peptidyl-prolyl cis-trans isomerase SlyD